MEIVSIDNVATAYTDYFSVNGLEHVALIPRTLLAHTYREDLLSELYADGKETVEIKINKERYILNNIIEEDDYFIFELDKVE